MGQDNARHPGSYRQALSERPEWAAGLCGGLAALLWFGFRMSPGVAFTPWQGPLLHGDSLEPIPPVAGILYGLAGVLPGGLGVWTANGLAVLLGAITCALASGIAAGASKWLVPRPVAAASGALAGVLLATSPSMTGAAAAAHPAVVTTALALGALALLLAALEREAAMPWLGAAAVAGGLAAANHAAFGLLIVLLLLVYFFHPLNTAALLPRAAFLTALFAAVALAPVLAAIWWTGGAGLLMSYALRSPYPAIGEAPPQWGFGVTLLREFPALALLPAAAAMVLFFRRPTQRYAVMLAAVFLMMGPFLPFLTNQYGAETFLQDGEAPLVMTLAAASIFIACGTAAALGAMFRHDQAPRLAIGTAVLAAALVVAFQFTGAPSRSHGAASAAAAAMLDACPANAILITGDRTLTSLALSAQRSGDHRTDVRVLPLDALVDTSYRNRANAHWDGAVDLPRVFPQPGALERWEREQPLQWRRLQDRDGDEEALRDLLVWDFVRDNAPERPMAFAGFAPAWLAARAGIAGPVLVYPREGHDDDGGNPTPFHEQTADLAPSRDPQGNAVLANILLPLSDSARRQGEAEKAAALATIAATLEPGNPSHLLALTRASARTGAIDDAREHGARYAALLPRALSGAEITEILDNEVRRLQMEEAFLGEARRDGAGNAEERQHLAEQLWVADELAILEQGYDLILEDNPEDLDALYHLAAARAQLGHIQEAHGLLGRWIEEAVSGLQLTAAEISSILENDGRFVLLRMPLRPAGSVALDPAVDPLPSGRPGAGLLAGAGAPAR